MSAHDAPLGRRQALAGATGLLVGLAGCASDGGDTSGDDGDGGGDAGDGGDGGDGSTSDETTGDDTSDETTDGSTSDETTDGGETGGDTSDGGSPGDETTAVEDLDLREANVTGVELEERADGYGVATTLIHDDDGEDGYANWWQVETLDGDRLGRRDLAHPHGTREFTRSTTVAIEVDRVVVRGHDQTHGYGGQAALVSVPDGDVELVRQGPEPESFADR